MAEAVAGSTVVVGAVTLVKVWVLAALDCDLVSVAAAPDCLS